MFKRFTENEMPEVIVVKTNGREVEALLCEIIPGSIPVVAKTISEAICQSELSKIEEPSIRFIVSAKNRKKERLEAIRTEKIREIKPAVVLGNQEEIAKAIKAVEKSPYFLGLDKKSLVNRLAKGAGLRMTAEKFAAFFINAVCGSNEVCRHWASQKPHEYIDALVGHPLLASQAKEIYDATVIDIVNQQIRS